MCLQISYTLTCEHVKTQTIYCADAQPVPASSPARDPCSRHHHHHHHKSHRKDGNGSGSGSGSNKKKKSSSSTASSAAWSARYAPALPSAASLPGAFSASSPASASFPSGAVVASSSSSSSLSASAHSSSSAAAGSSRMRPCRNLTQQSLPYPTPPSFACDPQTAATSLLAPKCPLPDCPFEVKNRCWNCCWCGKGWNERGRCSCIMIIEGNEVQCEHICCPECEAAEP